MTDEADKYRLTDADHFEIFKNDIVPDIFSGAKQVINPKAVIFGGQPGAGKSASVDAALLELEAFGGAIQIIGDDFRGYHPKYNELMMSDDKTAAFYTDRDSGKWVEMALKEALQKKVNFVVEGTMRDSDKVIQTITMARKAGFYVDVRALAVSKELSQLGIFQRYEAQKLDRGTGRLTTPQAHQAAYDGMLNTLSKIEGEGLADRLSIYKRGNILIYENYFIDNKWIKKSEAIQTVISERSRAMTHAELVEYSISCDKLFKMAMSSGRNATASELKIYQLLKIQANQKLLKTSPTLKMKM